MGRHRTTVAVGLLPLILILAACGGSATTAPATQAAAPSTAAESSTPSEAAPSEAAPSEAASAASSGETVEATTVGQLGTVLVAGSNGMTVYNFTKDVKDSGKSACGSGCIGAWPALTVPAGTTPTGGTGVTGTLATITRDDGTLQVTYNGLPLYFFGNDKAPGDANGVYTGWVAVKP
jgi:predicted lipoprotein with Yx(FWY)xxD motif